MQHDFYMSPTFYDELNSDYYSANGPIDKLEVYIKAQQLIQDYRQLRMLQMKVAALAMNVMNKSDRR
jgi:hypothetical protein